MISPSDFNWPLLGNDAIRHRHRTEEEPRPGSTRPKRIEDVGRSHGHQRTVFLAISGQFSWPSVGSFVAAYGHFFMATDMRAPHDGRSACSARRSLSVLRTTVAQ